MNRYRTYQFGKSKLTLRFDSITTSDAQVIVSSDDSYITMGGGVSAAIRVAGGEAIALDAAKKVPAALGDIVVTSAGALPAQYIFHAITIGPNPEGASEGEIVERATRRSMRLLEGLQLSSIAFPAIGAGAAGFLYEEVAARMAEVIADELIRRESPVEATIFLYSRSGQMDELDFAGFFEQFAVHSPRVAKNVVESPDTETAPKQAYVDLANETEDEYRRRRLHNLRKLLINLEDQRSQLEEKLITLLAADDPPEEERVRRALKENQELRFQYLSELRSHTTPAGGSPPVSPVASPLTVFVSSTSKDLVEHRLAAKDAIARCDLFFRGMEHFGADPDRLSAASLIVEEVNRADVYVGIFGVRYGSIDPVTGLSMTELEFRKAETCQKVMLLYVIHESAPVTVSQIEASPEGQGKLAALRAYILSQYVPYMFRGVEDLARQVYADLEKIKRSASDMPQRQAP